MIPLSVLLTTEQAVIIFNIFYQGVTVVPTNYTAPLLALNPVVAAANVTDYPGLTLIDGTDMANAVCTQHEAVNMMFPISIGSYNVAAQRAAFDAFNTLTNDTTFSNSAVLFEGYGTQAVKAVADASTAFPHRADNILMYIASPCLLFAASGAWLRFIFSTPVVSYAVDKTLDAKAIAFGESFRTALHEASGSSEMHTYINYAHGNETLQQVYGYDNWRQAKLKTLKTKYDPNGSFNFYAPI